jgi:hypothetical protein
MNQREVVEYLETRREGNGRIGVSPHELARLQGEIWSEALPSGFKGVPRSLVEDVWLPDLEEVEYVVVYLRSVGNELFGYRLFARLYPSDIGYEPREPDKSYLRPFLAYPRFASPVRS